MFASVLFRYLTCASLTGLSNEVEAEEGGLAAVASGAGHARLAVAGPARRPREAVRRVHAAYTNTQQHRRDQQREADAYVDSELAYSTLFTAVDNWQVSHLPQATIRQVFTESILFYFYRCLSELRKLPECRT